MTHPGEQFYPEGVHWDDPIVQGTLPALLSTAAATYGPRTALESSVGTLAEMKDGNVYDAVETSSRQQKLGYVHLRNVRDKVPHYKETFIDDGEVDVLRVLRILKKNNFTGVIIPDHAPQMSCAAPWHAGMAYALGFLRAGLKALERE